MSKIKVAILGCGPSGLLAAHAAELAGADFDILSIKAKSRIHGAQYLHKVIPEIEVASAPVVYERIGSEHIYKMKVYGIEPVITSWNKFEPGMKMAYSMSDLYDQLWAMYEPHIDNVVINDSLLTELERAHGYDLLISTVPRYRLCHGKNHSFTSRKMFIAETPEDQDIWPTQETNMIVYNGDPMQSWYRFSRLFGHSYLEFGQDIVASNDQDMKNMTYATSPHNIVPLRQAMKVIDHDCTCRPLWHRMGRFGKWERGVLAHESYWETKDALLQL